MVYDKVHRFLLRTVASQGVISVAQAEKIVSEQNQDICLQVMVKEINDEIKPYQQTIKITNDELTDEEIMVFLSLGYDEATKSQNIFNSNELEYFRLLIEEIMSVQTRQITKIHAVNIVGKMKDARVTKTDAEKLLSTWCRMRYLDIENNNYALGARAIHEFEPYLREHMPEAIEECFLCKQIVFRGCNCPACSLAIHTRCLNKYLEKLDKWPCCKFDFDPAHLERLNNYEKLIQTQTQQSQVSMEYNTIVEQTQEQFTEYINAEDIIPEISQRITKKRKRDNE